MAVNLRITYRDFPAPALAEERIRERVEKLARIHPRLVSCRVVAEAPHRRHHKGRLYRVRVDLTLPGNALVVNRDHHDAHAHEDFYVALRDAFDAAERRLKSYLARRRGEVRRHETAPLGTVARLFPDHGFIATPEGEEIYFPADSVVDGGFDRLEEGSEVRFVAAEKEGGGGLQVTTVRPLAKPRREPPDPGGSPAIGNGEAP